MPWTSADADQFKKGLSKKQKKKWANIANGALLSCMESGSSEKDCAGRAIKIANSKFIEFNPVISGDKLDTILSRFAGNPIEATGAPQEVIQIYEKIYSSCENLIEKDRIKMAWNAVHMARWFKNKEGRWVKRKYSEPDLEFPAMWNPNQVERVERAIKECVDAGGDPKQCRSNAIAKAKIQLSEKKFQYIKQTPPDPYDGHVHQCAYDEEGNGGTNEAGTVPHQHLVFSFKVQPFYSYNPEIGKEYNSVHPGSLAFSELGSCEMEIFRVGTHNGDKFSEEDLEEIASNFHDLKSELRPKLKITHHGEEEEQMSLAGLASYGDVTDVYLKRGADGINRLFARVENVPKEVLSWIRERRFPERSIEIYPKFKLGTKEDSPVYKNVLKAIALLGAEMPAVPGMEPIKLEECLECQGTSCLFQNFMDETIPGESREIEDLSRRMTTFSAASDLERKIIREGVTQ